MVRATIVWIAAICVTMMALFSCEQGVHALTPADYVYSSGTTYTVYGHQGAFQIGGISQFSPTQYRSNIQPVSNGYVNWGGSCDGIQVWVGWGHWTGTYIDPQWRVQGSFAAGSGNSQFQFASVTLPWVTDSNLHWFLSFECPDSNVGIRFYNFFTVTENCSPSGIAAIGAGDVFAVNHTFVPATNWKPLGTSGQLQVWKDANSAPRFTLCVSTVAQWQALFAHIETGATYVTASASSLSAGTLSFAQAGGMAPSGNYNVTIRHTLYNTLFPVGTVQVVPPTLSNAFTGRFYSWNTFDYRTGGELAVYGTGLGTSCDTYQLALQSVTQPAILWDTCTAVQLLSNGLDQRVLFSVPPSDKESIGYGDTVQLVYAADAVSSVTPVAIQGAANTAWANTVPQIPIVYAYDYRDHYEENVLFLLTWTGPWTGSWVDPWTGPALCPVYLARDGTTVTMTLAKSPFVGGASFSGTPQIITSHNRIPARFRPTVPMLRCQAMNMLVYGDGTISITNNDASHTLFDAVPSLYPTACTWTIYAPPLNTAETGPGSFYLNSTHDTRLSYGGSPYASPNYAAWEQWVVSDAGNGKIFITSWTGEQLSVDDQMQLSVSASRSVREQWSLLPISGIDRYYLVAWTGNHLGMSDTGTPYCQNQNTGTWEQWAFVPAT